MAENQKSVAQIAAVLANDPGFGDEVQKLVDSAMIIGSLVSVRLRKRLSQKEVAARMGVSKSKISKLESGMDRDIRLVDYLEYNRACGISTSFLFEDTSLPIATRIKHLVFQIHDGLNELVELARHEQDDEELCRAINEFTGEVLFNFLVRYKDIDDQMDVVMKPHAYRSTHGSIPKESESCERTGAISSHT